MQEYLRCTDVIDWDHSAIVDVANSLFVDGDQLGTASECFFWVRDNISHSFDAEGDIVTCTASEVLKHRTGICYAKAHLLAAILRANRIPTGFGYQRITAEDLTFCLHGFNFILLDEVGWYAVDPRGDRDEIQTTFDPPNASLAFKTELPGEQTFDTIFSEPLGCVVASLKHSKSVCSLRTALPDWQCES